MDVFCRVSQPIVQFVAGLQEDFGVCWLIVRVFNHLPLRDCREVVEEFLFTFAGLREAGLGQEGLQHF